MALTTRPCAVQADKASPARHPKLYRIIAVHIITYPSSSPPPSTVKCNYWPCLAFKLIALHVHSLYGTRGNIHNNGNYTEMLFAIYLCFAMVSFVIIAISPLATLSQFYIPISINFGWKPAECIAQTKQFYLCRSWHMLRCVVLYI